MPQVTKQLLKVDGRSSGLLWDKVREVHAGIAGETLIVHPGHRGSERCAEQRPAAVDHLSRESKLEGRSHLSEHGSL